jgi:hypothetical protein
MAKTYREQIRAAIVDIAEDIAAVQKHLTTAANEYERAKAEGKVTQTRANLEAERSLVLIAKAALVKRVEHLKELAAQIPANSDDSGLFDTLAIALEIIGSADEFIENSRDGAGA